MRKNLDFSSSFFILEKRSKTAEYVFGVGEALFEGGLGVRNASQMEADRI